MLDVFASQAAKEGVKAGGNILGQWLADKRSKKAQKRAEKKAGEVLEGLDISPGFFETPAAFGQFGRQGSGVGGGYTFSPEMQGLWESGLGRANTLGNLYGQYVTPDYFTEGPMFDMFNQSRTGRVQRGEDSAANAISQLFNTSGINTASGMDMSKIQADLNAAKAQEDAQQMFNMQKFLGGGLAQNQTAFDYINSMNMMGLDAYGRAQDASTIGTQLDIGKAAGMLGIIGQQPTGQGWGSVAAQSVGQGFGNAMDAYQMSQFFEGLGKDEPTNNPSYWGTPFFTSDEGQFSGPTPTLGERYENVTLPDSWLSLNPPE